MKKKEYCSLGIMSGTSLDGLDFSLLKTDGEESTKFIFNEYSKFNDEFQASIRSLIKKFNTLGYEFMIESSEYLKFNNIFTDQIFSTILYILKKKSINISSIDVVGLHGNTLLHKPQENISVQLGNAKFLAKRLKIPVISRFRENDIKKGGHGAPLVPIFHQYQFSKANKNIIVINIGGISNFSLISNKKLVLASDIGPGNKLIDEYCQKIFNRDFDKDGSLATKGKILKNLIEIWMSFNFLGNSFPISYDNFFFKLKNFSVKNKHDVFDVLRSLTFFSAYIIYCVKNKIKHKIDKWIFCGGGTLNRVLMKDLENLIGKDKFFVTNDFGLDPFYIESQAFSFISVRTLKKLPSTFPETTGCKECCVSGKKFEPS